MTMRAFNLSHVLSFPYTNHRGVNETRRVVFLGLDYGSNVFYPEPQWLMRTFDLDRKDYRSFALAKIDPGSIVVGAVGIPDLPRFAGDIR